MLKHALYAATGLAALAATASAIANDSTAEMTTGGLVLKNSRNIDMLDEDLYVSAEQIRVNYVFKNQGRADESVIVAFPMPDRDLSQEGEGDISWVSDFVTKVEGRPVQTQVERKAMLAGRDVTALLARYNVPVAPHQRFQEGVRDPVEAAFARLEESERAELARRGLIELGDGGEILKYLWKVKETYYWTQTFPAGRELKIQHQYKPGAGGSVGSVLSGKIDRRDPYTRRYMAEYCVDQAFLAAAARMSRAGGPDNYLLPDTTIGYILKTGGNWRSPIRNFRLVVDKGSPDNIVSFCGTGIRKISPTQFEMRRTNWRPDRDLRVLILSPVARPEGG